MERPDSIKALRTGHDESVLLHHRVAEREAESDFVERLKIENADWLDTLSIRNPKPSPSDPLGQRGVVVVVRKDGTEATAVVTDVVDEVVLRDILNRSRR